LVKHYQPAKPGAAMAGFRVLAEIGRGAASVIYLVQDPKSKQIWALKHVEKRSSKDQRFLDQALREAEVAQRVRNEYIRGVERVIKGRARLVQVNEVFLLMEYVDGISVEQHPPDGLEDAVAIFVQTARGLRHMHEKGFVHADMEPNNIVVTEGGGVKIIDLGQACPSGTVKERIQGTPDYIAPEQVHLREITPLTDVYNLGATMYWCLTRRHIPTAMPKEESLVDSLDDQFIEKPVPVSEVNPRVPPALSDLVGRCVEVKPEDRPEDMGVVAQTLEAIRSVLSGAGSRDAAAGAG
jgi:serine/threonine protein kinase